MSAWRDIAGLEGAYQVSSDGKVRSLDRLKTVFNRWGTETTWKLRGRELKLQLCTNDYLEVSLGKNNRHLVHRLVAVAFIPGDTSLQVNHKNGKRADNRRKNLEWSTCSENHLHSYRELPRKKHALTQRVKVGQHVYLSVMAASKALRVVPGSISSAALRLHRCRGMVVSYV